MPKEPEKAKTLRKTIRDAMDAGKAKSKSLRKMTKKFKAKISKGGYRERT